MNQPDIILSLSRERSGGMESLTIAWQQAIASMPDLPGEILSDLVRALPSPGAARHLALFLSREPDPSGAIKKFLSDIDESSESLDDWLSAFDVFANYIRGTAHHPTLSEAAGYLHCCEAVVDSGVRYETFPMAVETMLETFGYDGQA